MPARLPTFWLKLAMAVAIVAAADVLVFDEDGLGLNLGVLLTSATVALAPPSTPTPPLTPTANPRT